MANRLAKGWANVKLLQFPTCWPIKGLFVHWSRGWGVLSFSERLVWFGVPYIRDLAVIKLQPHLPGSIELSTSPVIKLGQCICNKMPVAKSECFSFQFPEFDDIYCRYNFVYGQDWVVTSVSIFVQPHWILVITLRPRQNGRHFADDVFKCIFLNEIYEFHLRFQLNFVPEVPVNNIPALVQIMAWRRSGDKPLSEPIMGSLLMHICALGLNELMSMMSMSCMYIYIFMKC